MIFCTHLFKREVLRGFLQLYSYLFAISDIQFARYFFRSWLKLCLGFVHVLYKGYLPFSWENRKFWLESQMIRAIPFGKLQNIWAVILDDAIFSLF